MSDDLMTAQEVADYLKLKKTTVYEMIKRGDLPSRKIGKQLRISRADVEKLSSPLSVEKTSRSDPDVIAGKHRNVVLCGQDVALDIIANYISSLPGVPNVLRSHAGSYNSLNRLYHGKSAIATAHLWDEETGEYNLPWLPCLLPGMDAVVVRMFGRMMGIYVQKGNPKQITSIEDFSREEITICNRETGSGTRIFLDCRLKALGIPKDSVKGYHFIQTSHLTAAGAVSRGEADAGLGMEAAARQVRDVEFIPLQLEWYDMIFAAELRDREPYAAILDFIASSAFQMELMQLGLYDLSQSGRQFIL